MQWWQWFFWGLALLSAGCSHALSPAVRQQLDTTLSLTQLHTTPEAYKDSFVMSGGDILSTRNLTEGTLFKVLQKPLDTTDRPLDMDRTEGHFMVLCEGYLDPTVYKQRTPGDTGWACPGHAYRHGCGRSQTDTSSGGRFLVLTPEYLETAIYHAGRAFTVAGEVRGPRGLPGGETV